MARRYAPALHGNSHPGVLNFNSKAAFSSIGRPGRNAHHVHHILDQFDHIHSRDLESLVPCFDPGDIEDVVDQCEQMISVAG
jgi:hypothetical protein